MTLILTSFEKDIAAKMPECKLDAKSGIYKEKGSEEALVSLGVRDTQYRVLRTSSTENWDGAEGAALLESSKCM